MMKLGMISHYDDESLKKVAQFGLSYIEFCINHHHETFIEQFSSIQKSLNQHQIKLASLGRWGTDRISKDGINQAEYEIDAELIEIAHQLGSPVYVTGCNYIDTISYESNLSYAIQYLKGLKSLTDAKGIKLAVYNCRWNNFIVGPDEWHVILNQLPGIGIKYDPSHAIRDQQDYLKELYDFGAHVFHIHLKGSLIIDQKVVDDPPAGLDSTNWPAFMALLYYLNYQDALSIEPHSSTWIDQLGDQGIIYSIDYFRKMILEDGK
jgi:sugar phosphate isomerase/epimerase